MNGQFLLTFQPDNNQLTYLLSLEWHPSYHLLSNSKSTESHHTSVGAWTKSALTAMRYTTVTTTTWSAFTAKTCRMTTWSNTLKIKHTQSTLTNFLKTSKSKPKRSEHSTNLNNNGNLTQILLKEANSSKTRFKRSSEITSSWAGKLDISNAWLTTHKTESKWQNESLTNTASSHDWCYSHQPSGAQTTDCNQLTDQVRKKRSG